MTRERYINLLTDFGFKRLFGSEPNKDLLIDFLNVVLPKEHRVKDLTYRNNENIGNTTIDRKAIFDIYCESETGEKFIVEIQKAKQNYFKDRSVYYSTFPIQEQAEKGDWNYKLSAVYTVGVLDFIFDDHKDDPTIMHVVELKNQHCEVFYDKLKFIYLELPKFTKTIDQLSSHFDKWLFLLKHLYELEDHPAALQGQVFQRLFEVAEIAQFSPTERESYENSLKYYRDLKNVVDTSREEGREVEARSLILRLLTRQVGELPQQVCQQVESLSLEQLENLGEDLLDFTSMADLNTWLLGLSDTPGESLRSRQSLI
jgi:predicted transposase/invertase (TIGR01784 family)